MPPVKDLDPTTNPLRQRPPSLFLGPPSRNVSNISLQPPPSRAPRDPLLRTRSARGNPAESNLRNSENKQQQQQQQQQQQRPPLPPSASADAFRTDALWAEMQATLAEVEMSALNSGSVFGQAHEAALEELRVAQMELAKGWGRMGAASEEDEDEDDVGGVRMKKVDGKASEGSKEKEKEKANVGGENVDDDDAEEKEEMEAARRRREENEKFFVRVQQGVEDVVGKLEKVAEAMGKVEWESRDVWGSEGTGSAAS